MDIKLSLDERKKMFHIAKGFATECEKKKIDPETTKEMMVEVLRATAECLIEDREKKQ
tara:strand:- start:1784 stop:1957 length:174 start_codon:yes stop_codon:yes gene_type:complete